jgi:hypothetical protein
MIQLVAFITLIFGIQITIDVGYFGKKITNMKDSEIPLLVNSSQSLYYRKYGDGYEIEPERIIFDMFSVTSQEFEKDESQNLLQEHYNKPKVLFYSYTRMLPSLLSLIPNCPFVTIDVDSQAENLSDIDNILMIHPFFIDRSTIYMMLDIRGHSTKTLFAKHVLMNLVLYIFNNSSTFRKPFTEIRNLIFELLCSGKIRLEFLNEEKTFDILVNNTVYLIDKFHLNHSKSYKDLIIYFLRHLKRDLKNFLVENFIFKDDESFISQVDHLLFVSVLDICNVVTAICGKTFNYVDFSFFDKNSYRAVALERCLILDIELDPFFNVSNLIFEGLGDENTDYLEFYQVGNSNKFIIGCNQIYNLYKEKIKLKVIVSNGSNIIERTLDIAEIIPNDNKLV